MNIHKPNAGKTQSQPMRSDAVGHILTIKERTTTAGDQMDLALDRLRTVHVALAPDNKSWHDEDTIFHVWAVLETVIKDLEPVRNWLQGQGEGQ